MEEGNIAALVGLGKAALLEEKSELAQSIFSKASTLDVNNLDVFRGVEISLVFFFVFPTVLSLQDK